MLTAEPRHVCDAAAHLAWIGKSLRFHADGDTLVVTPWVAR